MSFGGKIDRSGVLYIQRADMLVEQMCPYGQAANLHNCSHQCPMFGEPFRRQDGRWMMTLCGKFAVVFDKFLDERTLEDNEEDEQIEPNPV